LKKKFPRNFLVLISVYTGERGIIASGDMSSGDTGASSGKSGSAGHKRDGDIGPGVGSLKELRKNLYVGILQEFHENFIETACSSWR
jgi:hypothetical protein